MAGFAESIRNIWKIEELRQRILYTVGLPMIYRIGTFVTLPGVDASKLTDAASNSLFGFVDLFVGGAFSQAGIFALGIMPYITASIIFQLLGAVSPYFQKLQREGEEGRRKLTQLTRYGTVGITLVQSIGYALTLTRGANAQAVVIQSEPFFFAITAIVLTSGTIFVMWLGERITENGIGNGISLLIMISIISSLPLVLIQEFQTTTNFFIFMIEIGVLLLVIAGVILVSQGMRRIPVQYAKRVVGRKVYGGSTQYLPLRVNAAGVMPIIFAQSIMFLPGTVTQLFPESEFMQTMGSFFTMDSLFYWFIYGMMIIFFSYFYTAIVMDPNQLADNMKRQGGFIPGVRPGKRTAQYIDAIMTRITLPGSIALAFVAILPFFVTRQFNVTPSYSNFFGGTGLLIIVGVALDTLHQIESQLMTRNYEGFMKKGRIHGRRG